MEAGHSPLTHNRPVRLDQQQLVPIPAKHLLAGFMEVDPGRGALSFAGCEQLWDGVQSVGRISKYTFADVEYIYIIYMMLLVWDADVEGIYNNVVENKS